MAAEVEIQRALFQAISALGFTTHDVAPQRTDNGGFPYVEVGMIVLAPMDTKDQNGFDFVARIHTWGADRNMGPVKAIQGAIYQRLHHGDLTIAGQRMILLRREMSDCIRSADERIHGVCEYRGLIETT